MPTLKEAVESGRRWRYNDGVTRSMWHDASETAQVAEYPRWKTSEAISSDFELEPEPEKPREYLLHACDRPGGSLDQHFHEADILNPACFYFDRQIRVHDAEACDRLHDKHQRLVVSEGIMESWYKKFKAWQYAGEGSELEFYASPTSLVVRRGFEP